MWFIVGLLLGYGLCFLQNAYILNKMPLQLKKRIKDWKEAEIAKLKLDLED